ncbi:hypothetical protein X975_10272, partial [Stegodyphus mimosarum]
MDTIPNMPNHWKHEINNRAGFVKYNTLPLVFKITCPHNRHVTCQCPTGFSLAVSGSALPQRQVTSLS